MASTRLRRIAVAVSLTALTTGGVWTLGAQSALAASPDRYVATTGSDTNNDCSSAATPCKTVQHAVDEAVTGDTIHVAAGSYPESVLVGDLENDPDNLTIVGAGKTATKITGYPAGNAVGFGIDIEDIPTTLRDLSFTGVNPGSGADDAPGFGVEVEGTTATLDDVSASGNAAGGVFGVNATTTATGSNFDDNGNGVDTGEGFAGCGVFALGGSASVTTSSASSNKVCGVAVLGGLAFAIRSAAAPVTGSLTFTSSTAADNSGPGLIDLADQAGQVDDSTLAGNAGAAIDIAESTVAITRSTLTTTKKFTAAALADQAAILVETVSETDDVVTPSKVNRTLRAVNRRSSAKYRSARYRPEVAVAPASSMVTVSGSIVADNSIPDCSQKVTDGGYNISGDAANSCGLSAAKHSQIKTDPKLGSLGSHGGLTQTQLPLKASPAIDAIPAGSAGCTPDAVDQRGDARPQPTGGRCDVGSVELAGAKLAITTPSLPNGTVGKDYSATVHATGGQYPTYTWTLADGSVPGLSFSSGGVLSGKPTKAGTYTVTVSVNDPVTRTYTVVIDTAGAGTDGSGSKLADTGVPTQEIGGAGLALLIGGLIALYGAVLLGRPLGRHRRPTN